MESEKGGARRFSVKPSSTAELQQTSSSSSSLFFRQRASSLAVGASGSSNRPSFSLGTSANMVRTQHVIVAGAKRVGKTCILQQLAFCQDFTAHPYFPTLDDTYMVSMDGGDRPKEILVLHDTGGIPSDGPAQLKSCYLSTADAYILVYNISDADSFNRVDLLKKFIDRHAVTLKEKREIPIIVLGNQLNPESRQVEIEFSLTWSQRERVKFYEVNAAERKTLVEPIVYLGSKLFHPPKESKFSLSKKLKPDKPGAAIVMDI